MAVQLDDQSAEAHTPLAFMLYKFEWKWDDSQREFKRALARDRRQRRAGAPGAMKMRRCG